MNFTQQQKEFNRLNTVKYIIEQTEFSNVAISFAEQAVAATYQFDCSVPDGKSPKMRTYQKDVFAVSFYDKIQDVKFEQFHLKEGKETLISMMEGLIDFYNPVHKKIEFASLH